jgi:hypothetical protein
MDLEGEPYTLIISYSDVVDFLKSSETNLAIGVIFDNYRGRPEYRSIARSLSGRGY